MNIDTVLDSGIPDCPDCSITDILEFPMEYYGYYINKDKQKVFKI